MQRLQADMINDVRQAAEVHRQVSEIEFLVVVVGGGGHDLGGEGVERGRNRFVRGKRADILDRLSFFFWEEWSPFLLILNQGKFPQSGRLHLPAPSPGDGVL